MKLRPGILIAAAFFLLQGQAGMGSKEGYAAEVFKEVAKIKVTQEGNIYINNQLVSEPDFVRELERLKAVGGAVDYYRESPELEPTPAQFRVFQKIVEARLPVKLSEKDFG